MRQAAILLLVLFLAGCGSGVVRTEYDTLTKAKEAGAFKRGWLPPILPDSSTSIVEENELDVNYGRGSFHFPAQSMPPYLRTLGTEHGATVTKSSFGISVVVTNSSTLWEIKLDPQKGTGMYSVRQRGERAVARGRTPR